MPCANFSNFRCVFWPSHEQVRFVLEVKLIFPFPFNMASAQVKKHLKTIVQAMKDKDFKTVLNESLEALKIEAENFNLLMYAGVAYMQTGDVSK